MSSFDRVLLSVGEQSVTLGQLLLIPILLTLGYLVILWSTNLLVNRLTSHAVEPGLVHLIRRVLYIVALVILVLTTLEVLNVPMTAFAFVSGAVAIGVGFGAQNIINNFIGGWILMWERPIRIGDFVEFGPNTGTVEAINTRSTRIRRTDGVHMLVPNSTLLENTVVNWTLIDRVTRTHVRVGVSYGSPVEQVAELILQATQEHEATLTDPPAKVIFEDFGDNALVFDTYFWINASAERELRQVRSDIRFRIVALFDSAGIVVAFPQRDVHLDGRLTLIDEKAAVANGPGVEP